MGTRLKLKKKPECLTSEVHHCPKSIETCQIKNNHGIPDALPSLCGSLCSSQKWSLDGTEGCSYFARCVREGVCVGRCVWGRCVCVGQVCVWGEVYVWGGVC